MDTTALEAAFQNVIDTVALREVREATLEPEWDSAHVLAHLTAANRGIADLVARVFAGAELAPFTNRGALQRPYLDAIIRSAGSAGLIAEFERSSREVLDTCAALDDQALRVEIDATFWESGEIVFQGHMPLSHLLDNVVPGHLAGHTEQLIGGE